MKKIIQQIFKVRRTLISHNRSHIDKQFALDFMMKFEFWMAQPGAKINSLAEKHRETLFYIAPPSFHKKLHEAFENLENTGVSKLQSDICGQLYLTFTEKI
jgi:hypothetical protein